MNKNFQQDTDYQEELIKLIKQKDFRVFQDAYMGTLYYWDKQLSQGKCDDISVIYCTPFWEDVDGIAIGHDTFAENLPFKLTGNLEIDSDKFMDIMNKWLDIHGFYSFNTRNEFEERLTNNVYIVT